MKLVRFASVLATLLVTGIVVAGCGGGGTSGASGQSGASGSAGVVEAGEGQPSEAGEEREEPSNPEMAAAEAEKVSDALDRALDQLRAGDSSAAATTVGDAYLEHYEKVEGPLGQVDPELMEDLERLISTTIRQKMKQGASVAEVQPLVDEAQRGLDRAVAELR